MFLFKPSTPKPEFPLTFTPEPDVGYAPGRTRNTSGLSTESPPSELLALVLSSTASLLEEEEEEEGYEPNDRKPWSRFKQPMYAVAMLSVAYSVVAVVGVVSNALVVAVVCRRPKMRSVTNCFLSNLAVADILVCVSVLPITLLENIFTEWWYGPVLCKAFPYLQGVSVSASVNTLAAVAVERFMATFYPLTSKMTSRSAAVVIGFLWSVPALLFVPWVFVFSEVVFSVGRYRLIACHQSWTDQRHRLAFTVVVVFFTCYLLPLIVIGIFCLMIAVRVRQRRVRGMTAGSRADVRISRSKSRVLTMLAVVFVVFAVSWAPLYGANFYVLVRGPALTAAQRQALKHYFVPVAQWLGASNSCVNPFIYCCFGQNFRRCFAEIVSSLQRNRRCSGTPKSVRSVMRGTDVRSTEGPPLPQQHLTQ